MLQAAFFETHLVLLRLELGGADTRHLKECAVQKKVYTAHIIFQDYIV